MIQEECGVSSGIGTEYGEESCGECAVGYAMLGRRDDEREVHVCAEHAIDLMGRGHEIIGLEQGLPLHIDRDGELYEAQS